MLVNILINIKLYTHDSGYIAHRPKPYPNFTTFQPVFWNVKYSLISYGSNMISTLPSGQDVVIT